MPTPSILNVKEPLVTSGGIIPPAVGDGCNDDTAAIQAHLDALQRSDATPSGECGTGGDTWAPWPVAVYFPAGIYRITAPLRIPFTQFFRLYGDGRGGSFQGTVPMGTIIRQDANGQPIIVFERPDTHNWTIERLGF